MRIKLTPAGWLVTVLVVLFLFALVFPGLDTRRKRHHSCVLCRLTRDDYEASFGRHWSEFVETACSKWYRYHIKEKHEHVWQASPSTGYTDIFGHPVGVGDADRPAGILSLTPEQQVGIYEHIPNIGEAKQLFLQMREDAESRDESRYSRVSRQSRVLHEWAESGFMESWNSIWGKLDVHETQ